MCLAFLVEAQLYLLIHSSCFLVSCAAFFVYLRLLLSSWFSKNCSGFRLYKFHFKNYIKNNHLTSSQRVPLTSAGPPQIICTTPLINLSPCPFINSLYKFPSLSCRSSVVSSHSSSFLVSCAAFFVYLRLLLSSWFSKNCSGFRLYKFPFKNYIKNNHLTSSQRVPLTSAGPPQIICTTPLINLSPCPFINSFYSLITRNKTAHDKTAHDKKTHDKKTHDKKAQCKESL